MNKHNSKFIFIIPVYNSTGSDLVRWRFYGTTTGSLLLPSLVTGLIPSGSNVTSYQNPSFDSESIGSYDIVDSITLDSGVVTFTKNNFANVLKLSDNDLIVWDSELQKWINVRNTLAADNAALNQRIDSDFVHFSEKNVEIYDKIEESAGRFTIFDSDSIGLKEPGNIQWSALTGVTNLTNNYFEAFTRRGLVKLPGDVSTNAFGALGFQCFSGSGNPPKTLVPTNNPAKAIYTDKAENRIWIYDNSIELDFWEEVKFGYNVRLLADEANALPTSTGEKISFYYKVPDSEGVSDKEGGMFYEYFHSTNFPPTRIETLEVVEERDTLLAYWYPPSSGGTSTSTLPLAYAAYISSTKEFAYLGEAVGAIPDNTWVYFPITILLQDSSYFTSDNIDYFVKRRAWDDGATYWDRQNKKLYIREKTDATDNWEQISGDILQSEYDSDVHRLKAYDSDFKVSYDSDLLRTRHDFAVVDSDIRTENDSDFLHFTNLIEKNLGKFTYYDSDSSILFDLGKVQWSVTSTNLANNFFRVITPKGFVNLPGSVSVGAFNNLGFQCLTGLGNPNIEPNNNPAKGVYTDKSSNRLWVYDSSIGLNTWQEVFFGSNVFLTNGGAESILSGSINGSRFGFWYKVPDSDAASDQQGGLLVEKYYALNLPAQNIQDLGAVQTINDLYTIWRPPNVGGSDQSSFPVIHTRYVVDTQEFAHVADASGTIPDNTWTYLPLSAVATITDPYTDEEMESVVRQGSWADGVTFWDRQTKKLYIRERTQFSDTWERVGGDITQDEYDSDLAAQKEYDSHFKDAYDSDNVNRKLTNLFDVYIETDKLDHNYVLRYDSDSEVWTAKPAEFDGIVTGLKVQKFDIVTNNTTQFTLENKAVGQVKLFRNGISVTPEAVSLDSDFITVRYSSARNDDIELVNGDIIHILYVRTYVVIPDDFDISSVRLTDLLDVNITSTPQKGDVLAWDSDLNSWSKINISDVIETIDGGSAAGF
jgi:hypothetical protein